MSVGVIKVPSEYWIEASGNYVESFFSILRKRNPDILYITEIFNNKKM